MILIYNLVHYIEEIGQGYNQRNDTINIKDYKNRNNFYLTGPCTPKRLGYQWN